MSKRILIHAGIAKTGSSALQHYLVSSRHKLESHGYLYPDHPLDKNNISSGHLHNYMREKNGIQNIINNFLKVEEYHTLLLSSELFWTRIEELNEMYTNIEFIVFYRDLTSRRVSAYIQGVKRHFFTKKYNTKSSGMVIKDRIFELLSNTNININFLPYMYIYDTSWSIVNMFLDYIEPGDRLQSLYQQKQEIQTINPAYTIEAFEFKRYLNRYIPKHPPFLGMADKIDAILQRFSTGCSNFSFYTDDEFANNKIDEREFLNILVIKYNQTYLKPLIHLTEHAENNKYIDQGITERQVYEIVRYFAGEDIKLLKKIFDLLPVQKDNINTIIYNVLYNNEF